MGPDGQHLQRYRARPRRRRARGPQRRRPRRMGRLWSGLRRGRLRILEGRRHRHRVRHFATQGGLEQRMGLVGATLRFRRRRLRRPRQRHARRGQRRGSRARSRSTAARRTVPAGRPVSIRRGGPDWTARAPGQRPSAPRSRTPATSTARLRTWSRAGAAAFRRRRRTRQALLFCSSSSAASRARRCWQTEEPDGRALRLQPARAAATWTARCDDVAVGAPQGDQASFGASSVYQGSALGLSHTRRNAPRQPGQLSSASRA